MLMEKNLTATVYEMNTKLSVSSSIFIFSICHFAVVGLSEMLAIKIQKRGHCCKARCVDKLSSHFTSDAPHEHI